MTMNGYWNGFRIARLAAVSMLALMAFGTKGVRAEEGELAKNILSSIGLIPEEKDPIQYRERAPLVLPPKADLPPPVVGSVGEKKLKNWPKDPDVAAARERAADAVVPRTQTREWKANQNDRVSPEELRRTRSADRDPADRSPVNPMASNKREADGWVHPDTLRATAKSYRDSEEIVPGKEPQRQELTDPPTGYRRAAGDGKFVPTAQAPRDLTDPGSPYYMEQQRQKRARE